MRGIVTWHHLSLPSLFCFGVPGFCVEIVPFDPEHHCDGGSCFSHFGGDTLFNVTPDNPYKLMSGLRQFFNPDGAQFAVHVELETVLLQGVHVPPIPEEKFAFPEEGDRVEAQGRWVVDCGHLDDGQPIGVEIHPPDLIVVGRADDMGRVRYEFKTGSGGRLFASWAYPPDRTLEFDLWPMARPTANSAAFGSPTSIPVLGDWNGDGHTKIGVFDNGIWYLDYNGNGIATTRPSGLFRQK